MQVPQNNQSSSQYRGTAVGSPAYGGSLQTANGVRAIETGSSITSEGFDPNAYTKVCSIRNGILATPDARFAALLSHYKKTGEIRLSPQDPKNYEDAIRKAAPITTRIMVATKEQWVEVQRRLQIENAKK